MTSVIYRARGYANQNTSQTDAEAEFARSAQWARYL